MGRRRMLHQCIFAALLMISFGTAAEAASFFDAFIKWEEPSDPTTTTTTTTAIPIQGLSCGELRLEVEQLRNENTKLKNEISLLKDGKAEKSTSSPRYVPYSYNRYQNPPGLAKTQNTQYMTRQDAVNALSGRVHAWPAVQQSHLSECQEKRRRLRWSTTAPYVPACAPDGEYEPLQCKVNEEAQVKCWCGTGGRVDQEFPVDIESCVPQCSADDRITMCEDPKVAVAFDCPENYTQWGQDCYRFYEKEVTWALAEAWCVRDGGHLVSIHSLAEQDFIWTTAKSIKDTRWWIGLNDRKEERAKNRTDWVWSDGSAYDFRHWLSPEPNSIGDEDFGQLEDSRWKYQNVKEWDAGRWNDNSAGYECYFVCKITAGNQLE